LVFAALLALGLLGGVPFFPILLKVTPETLQLALELLDFVLERRDAAFEAQSWSA